jgi:2-succinyl-6-hydroxy-2,4-cyclohexadiene-1-carboxylate synthase
MKRAAANGIEMAYDDFGSGDRPLVLVHGFTGARRDFSWRFDALAELGRCIALDLRGHGDSTHTGDAASYTLDHLASDLLGFLEAAGIESCDLLGHSMGGMAVLRAALADSSRVASLLLMDTAARCPDGIPRRLIELAGQVAREAGMQKLVEVMRARAGDPDMDRTEADRRLEREWGDAYWTAWRYPNFQSMDPIAYGAFGAAILDQAPLLPRLGEIRCPTTVIVGSGDASFLEPADELLRGIPGARRAEIPDAGHQPQLENPAAWIAAIRDHLRRARDFPPS